MMGGSPSYGRMLLVGLGALMAAIALFGPMRAYAMCIMGPPFETDVCPPEEDKRARKQRGRLWGAAWCAAFAACCWYFAVKFMS